MTILLTAAAVLLVLGLVLMFLGITGRRDVREPAIPTTADAGPPGTAPAGNVDYAPVTSRSSRKMRTVPLIFGLLLALAGGIGLALILREGLESDRVDRWMLTKWPAGSLAGDLDDPDPVTTHEAKVELKRRYEAGELSEDVERSLAERKMRKVLAAPGDESAPYHIVDVDLGEARKKGLIEDER